MKSQKNRSNSRLVSCTIIGILCLTACTEDHSAKKIKENNILLDFQIAELIANIEKCSHNKLYLDLAKEYSSKFDSIIELVNSKHAEEAQRAIRKLFAESEWDSTAFNSNLNLLDENSEAAIYANSNTLKIMEVRLISDLYQMRMQSTFDFNAVQLVAINNIGKLGENYESKIAVIGVNDDNPYKILIEGDTLSNYNDEYFPVFRRKADKKGINTVKAIFVINQWGRKVSLPLKFTYEVR